MNERIKKLLEQATHDCMGVDQVDQAKFAELLVKECIGVPYAMWDKAELNADIAVKIEHRIREHFGVEE